MRKTVLQPWAFGGLHEGKKYPPLRPFHAWTGYKGAAKILGVHHRTVRRMVAEGQLSVTRHGPYSLLFVADVEELRDRRNA